MSEVTTLSTASITTEVVKASFSIELTRNKFQAIQQEVNSLVYSEDNLQVIADTVKKLNDLKKVVDKKHSEGKAEYWRVCTLYDTVKRETNKIIDDIISVPQKKYTELALAIQERKRKQLFEQQRVDSIKTGIDNNIMAFSELVASAETPQHLVAIEKNIALEKTRKLKYQEFLPEAIIRFDEVLELVKKQKLVVKEATAVKVKLAEAVTNGDEEAIMELTDKQEDIANRIDENKINVQEMAVGAATSAPVVYAQEILPEVKAKRTVWKAEIIDPKEAVKKSFDMLDISLNNEKIKTSISVLKDAKVFEGKVEYISNGIRYYEIKTMI